MEKDKINLTNNPPRAGRRLGGNTEGDTDSMPEAGTPYTNIERKWWYYQKQLNSIQPEITENPFKHFKYEK